ncbi:hypothetical protein CAEBREN_12287 [Caenorhabditis brenneri]|uniref:Homeobox domain-containing protein n=1 Tax=Caenorhabditis brenneri TaxID=135651 RepID=G0N6V4_CAEBE|nr:hypothetical protein CAEBREN_12287 [Caenorhabditis brenneri]
MYNNFLSIENPNPLFPSMPFMMPPMMIASWMMPGMPGQVPMMAPTMDPGQMPTNYHDYITQDNAPPYPQAYPDTLRQFHANPSCPPGIPIPSSSPSKKTDSQSVFHSLVVKKLLKYIEEKTNKDYVKVEVIDLVSDEEEEEEIDVVDSPIIENSMMDVISPQDSGRYFGESDAPQTDEEEPEVSMEDELIVVDSPREPSISMETSAEEPSSLDFNPSSTSDVPTVKQQKFSVGKWKRRKYSEFFMLFTTAQIECLENMFSRNGTIKPKQVKHLAAGNELVEEQIKKWLKHRRNMRYKTNVRERKRMENMSGLMMGIEALRRK